MSRRRYWLAVGPLSGNLTSTNGLAPSAELSLPGISRPALVRLDIVPDGAVTADVVNVLVNRPIRGCFPAGHFRSSGAIPLLVSNYNRRHPRKNFT